MPPRRHDPAEHAAQTPPESYASIWSELSEAQRSAILAAINSTDPGPRPTAAQETMHALRRELLDEALVARPSAGPVERPLDLPAPGEQWSWRPEDNRLVAANFDPGLIVGGSAPDPGVLVCQRLAVPAHAPVDAVLLDVVSAGSALTIAAAAVYEADGSRAASTVDQTAAWSTAGVQRMPLTESIAARPEPRAVWVAFVADGATLPGFAVPWIGKAARPNLGLPAPGPQRAGEFEAQPGCPDTIVAARMQPGQQYWVGLA